ncbi:MAG: response regulator transcription factor [Lachnospiraceae bacterium]|nr:response regulator transcription factor [Lachnospiraceae bacterium]
MYHIIICDDEKAFVSEVKESLERYAKEKGLDFQIQVYYDGKDLIDHYEVKFDLIFMDIKMERVDGLKAAEEIRKRDKEVGLIFLTSVAEHVFRGYEFGAVNYLLKPLKYERLEMELDRFFSTYSGKKERLFVVDNHNTMFSVPYKKIRYIEVEKRNVLMHYEKQQQIIHKSMKEMAQLFKSETAFARCHASFLVNLSYVTGVEGMEAVLSTGERIPISHPKKREFMLRLAEYWGSMV